MSLIVNRPRSNVRSGFLVISGRNRTREEFLECALVPREVGNHTIREELMYFLLKFFTLA